MFHTLLILFAIILSCASGEKDSYLTVGWLPNCVTNASEAKWTIHGYMTEMEIDDIRTFFDTLEPNSTKKPKNQFNLNRLQEDSKLLTSLQKKWTSSDARFTNEEYWQQIWQRVGFGDQNDYFRETIRRFDDLGLNVKTTHVIKPSNEDRLNLKLFLGAIRSATKVHVHLECSDKKISAVKRMYFCYQKHKLKNCEKPRHIRCGEQVLIRKCEQTVVKNEIDKKSKSSISSKRSVHFSELMNKIKDPQQKPAKTTVAVAAATTESAPRLVSFVPTLETNDQFLSAKNKTLEGLQLTMEAAQFLENQCLLTLQCLLLSNISNERLVQEVHAIENQAQQSVLTCNSSIARLNAATTGNEVVQEVLIFSRVAPTVHELIQRLSVMLVVVLRQHHP
ncbi:hypothetical protein B4U80_11948 [Leptotrombidium deliense]|uniref:Uncharacterized protein n=1 Tax=Leptotrombidium deliense TaxID=299467 RepID=A0A443S0H2_9ACAR|nr:hypothetical protein B4U80_11948 [Leptotrombidium deliense]